MPKRVTRDISVVVRIGDRTAAACRSIAAAIGEVLYILLDNASKYCAGGHDDSGAAAVADEHHVRLAVDRRRPGIPPELREQVFEKFFRDPGTRVASIRAATGIGLGLPIARRLVESQAGPIWIETPAVRPGHRVALTLPVRAAPDSHPKAKDRAAALHA